MRFSGKKLPRGIAGHSKEFDLEGRPGLTPRYSPGMGVRGFPLTSAQVSSLRTQTYFRLSFLFAENNVMLLFGREKRQQEIRLPLQANERSEIF